MLLEEGIGGGGELEEFGEVVLFVGGEEVGFPVLDAVEVGFGEGFDDFVVVGSHAGVAEEPVVDPVRRAGGECRVSSDQ